MILKVKLLRECEMRIEDGRCNLLILNIDSFFFLYYLRIFYILGKN